MARPVFDPDNVDATCDALARASEAGDGAAAARLEAARRKVDDCDKRLAKYRAALEAGAEPLIVAGWMREVQGERLTSESELTAVPAAEPLSKTQIRALVAGVRDALQLLAGADPALKTEIYADLGIELTYDPTRRRLVIESHPACATERVGGASTHSPTPTLHDGPLKLDEVA